jgi:hypothetical protein
VTQNSSSKIDLLVTQNHQRKSIHWRRKVVSESWFAGNTKSSVKTSSLEMQNRQQKLVR